MTIDRNTTIKALLDEKQEDVIQALESLNKNFGRLRNPLLRKVLAKRVSIEQACNMAGCNVRDFFKSMEKIGFQLNKEVPAESIQQETTLEQLDGLEIIEMDVRPILNSNRDPLNEILDKLKELDEGQCLKIVNSFEPVPLISLLARKGYGAITQHVSAEVVTTYFFKADIKTISSPELKQTPNLDPFDETLARFKDHVITIDVRNLEMPAPMHAILDKLALIPNGYALFVHHKKVPVYLLPHLHDKGFEYLISDETEGKISMLIFKN